MPRTIFKGSAMDREHEEAMKWLADTISNIPDDAYSLELDRIARQLAAMELMDRILALSFEYSRFENKKSYEVLEIIAYLLTNNLFNPLDQVLINHDRFIKASNIDKHKWVCASDALKLKKLSEIKSTGQDRFNEEYDIMFNEIDEWIRYYSIRNMVIRKIKKLLRIKK